MAKIEKKSTAKIVVLARGRDAVSNLLALMEVAAKMSGGDIVYHMVENDAEMDEEEDESSVSELPAALDTSEMRGMLGKLVEAGVLGDGYQLMGQSWTERSVIVAFLSGEVKKKCMWSAFAQLWGCDKKALQTAYSGRCDTDVARKYYQKLTKILG